MAKGQIPTTEKFVTCGTCRNFRRDTEGRSYRRDTGEYFMGLCHAGLTPDTIIKQFADKPCKCKIYNKL